MAQKTSGELEKELMGGIKTLTGKDLTTWLKILDAFDSKKRNEIIAWLKAEHGFRHMNAALLGGIHANGGKPVYANRDDLLENQFVKAPDRDRSDDQIRRTRGRIPHLVRISGDDGNNANSRHAHRERTINRLSY